MAVILHDVCGHLALCILQIHKAAGFSASPCISARVRRALVDVTVAVCTCPSLRALANVRIHSVRTIAAMYAWLRRTFIDIICAVEPAKAILALAAVFVPRDARVRGGLCACAQVQTRAGAALVCI